MRTLREHLEAIRDGFSGESDDWAQPDETVGHATDALAILDDAEREDFHGCIDEHALIHDPEGAP